MRLRRDIISTKPRILRTFYILQIFNITFMRYHKAEKYRGREVIS